MMNGDVPFFTRKCNYGQGHVTMSYVREGYVDLFIFSGNAPEHFAIYV